MNDLQLTTRRFYVTFGHGQKRGIGFYSIIHAIDGSRARVMASHFYGKDWSQIYNSPEEAGVEKFDLKLHEEIGNLPPR